MSSIRKGRNFELFMHKQLKNILGNVHIQKWSGTKEEPGDLYTDTSLFDCKHVAGYSESDIKNWYRKLTREAQKSRRTPILILKKSGTRSIQIIFDIKYLPIVQSEVYSVLGRFYWEEGIKLVTIMECYHAEQKKLQETTSS